MQRQTGGSPRGGLTLGRSHGFEEAPQSSNPWFGWFSSLLSYVEEKPGRGSEAEPETETLTQTQLSLSQEEELEEESTESVIEPEPELMQVLPWAGWGNLQALLQQEIRVHWGWGFQRVLLLG